MDFKVFHTFEGFWAPCGYWITLHEGIGEPGWVVTVHNYATFKHRSQKFPDEGTARAYYAQWDL